MSYKTYSWRQLHTHLLVQVCIVVVHWHQKSHMLKCNDRLLCWWFWIVLHHQQSSFSDWMITGNKPLLELIRTLVCENVLCSVSQLVQIWQTGVLDHWWRTAQDNKDVSGRSGEVVLDHLRGYEPWTVAPILRKRKRERKKDQLSTSRHVFRQFTCQYCIFFDSWETVVWDIYSHKCERASILPLCWHNVRVEETQHFMSLLLIFNLSCCQRRRDV